jgi:Fic family protein
MQPPKLTTSPCGHLVLTDAGQWAFVPDPLPRHLNLSSAVVYRLDAASRAVATLSGVGETLPNPHLLIGPFLSREAVLSSRIEGTQASISDLFQFEAFNPRGSVGDVSEVANYVRALEHGLELLQVLPICVRLIDAMHELLMSGVRGQNRHPGELRTEQVWIGSPGARLDEARYIPPPGYAIRDLLSDWEEFVNDDFEMPPLIQCALMHYQFEAVHPYLDGNGRIGRLLIILFLCAKGVLSTPLLYLSAYFERHREAYYDHLYSVSATGEWEPWLRFFLEGVAEQAKDALARSRRLRDLEMQYRHRLQERGESSNGFRLLDALLQNPYMTAPLAARTLGVTPYGAKRILDRLTDAEVIEYLPDQWPHMYVARELLDVISAPTASPSWSQPPQ